MFQGFVRYFTQKIFENDLFQFERLNLEIKKKKKTSENCLNVSSQ